MPLKTHEACDGYAHPFSLPHIKRHSLQEIDRIVHRTNKCALASTFNSHQFLCSTCLLLVCTEVHLSLLFHLLCFVVFSLLSLATLVVDWLQNKLRESIHVPQRTRKPLLLGFSIKSSEKDGFTKKKSRRNKKMKVTYDSDLSRWRLCVWGRRGLCFSMLINKRVDKVR